MPSPLALLLLDRVAAHRGGLSSLVAAAFKRGPPPSPRCIAASASASPRAAATDTGGRLAAVPPLGPSPLPRCIAASASPHGAAERTAAAPPGPVGGGSPEARPEDARLELYTMGRGESGALGHGSDAHERRPRRVAAFDAPGFEPPVTIAAGLFHTAALGASGRLWIWGRGAGGRLGQVSAHEGRGRSLSLGARGDARPLAFYPAREIARVGASPIIILWCPSSTLISHLFLCFLSPWKTSRGIAPPSSRGTRSGLSRPSPSAPRRAPWRERGIA